MEEGNPLIALAKKMSSQMFQMAEFARGRGELQVCIIIYTYITMRIHYNDVIMFIWIS